MTPKPTFAELQVSWDKATQYKLQVDLATRMVVEVRRAVERASLGQEASTKTLERAQQAADEAMTKVKKAAQQSCPDIGDSYFAKVEQATDYRLNLAFSLDVMKLGQGQAKLRILTQDELSK